MGVNSHTPQFVYCGELTPIASEAMARAIYYNIFAYSHVKPTLSLVRELVLRGDEIIYYGTPELRDEIERTGATYRECLPPDPSPPPYWNPILGAHHLLRQAEHLLPRLLEEARRDQPTYILHDTMCWWGRCIALILGLPCVTSFTTIAFQPDLARQMGYAPKWRQVLAAPRALWESFRVVQRLNRKHQLFASTRAALDALLGKGTLNVVHIHRELQPMVEELDDSYHFVGPDLVEPVGDPDFPMESLVDHKVVYIATGSIATNRPAFYRLCLEAFAGCGFRVVMSVGNKLDLETLGPIPSNCMVFPFVPQFSVLRHCDLFLTHCGMGSISEGLYHGVPFLLDPQTPEQHLVAEQVMALGVGSRLKPEDLHPRRLARRVDELLDDQQLYAASRSVAESMRGSGNLKCAVDRILEMTRPPERIDTRN